MQPEKVVKYLIEAGDCPVLPVVQIDTVAPRRIVRVADALLEVAPQARAELFPRTVGYHDRDVAHCLYDGSGRHRGAPQCPLPTRYFLAVGEEFDPIPLFYSP
jgi:hypothetical protein